MTEIYEIDTNRTYRVNGNLILTGNELIHKIADGYRYELEREQKEGVINE